MGRTSAAILVVAAVALMGCHGGEKSNIASRKSAQQEESPGVPTAQAFADRALMEGQYEAMAGAYAGAHAQSEETRSFGKLMVTDFETRASNLKAIVKTSGDLQMPSSGLDAIRVNRLAQLKRADERSLDASYLKLERDAQQASLTFASTYADFGDNTALKSSASDIRLMLEHHIDRLNRLQAASSHNQVN